MLDTESLLALLNVKDYDRDLISIFHAILMEPFAGDKSVTS